MSQFYRPGLQHTTALNDIEIPGSYIACGNELPRYNRIEVPEAPPISNTNYFCGLLFPFERHGDALADCADPPTGMADW